MARILVALLALALAVLGGMTVSKRLAQRQIAGLSAEVAAAELANEGFAKRADSLKAAYDMRAAAGRLRVEALQARVARLASAVDSSTALADSLQTEIDPEAESVPQELYQEIVTALRTGLRDSRLEVSALEMVNSELASRVVDLEELVGVQLELISGLEAQIEAMDERDVNEAVASGPNWFKRVGSVVLPLVAGVALGALAGG
jgi:chromosome segregation ATPase